jgi:hypothetical protein
MQRYLTSGRALRAARSALLSCSSFAAAAAFGQKAVQKAQRWRRAFCADVAHR